MNPEATAVATPAEQRIERICKTIRAEEQRLRQKYPVLHYQNLIGLGILLLSLIGMIASAWLFYAGFISGWLCIVVSAIFASISHELEHDLIHRQYFRKNAFMQNFMMLVVWIMRPNTISPWFRRKMHFLHHKVSGTEQDLEERLVGNGRRYGFARYLVMFDNLLGMLVSQKGLRQDIKSFSVFDLFKAGFPFAVIYFVFWYAFLLFHAYDFFWGQQAYPAILTDAMSVIDFVVVVLIAPNFIRSGCLNFVTSAMHYYGGVNNLLQQTQILKPWFFAPLHLFCFNFGSTHAIHHFVVGQPFYLRQMVARVAHRVMMENGVRYNDLSTFSLANRYVGH